MTASQPKERDNREHKLRSKLARQSSTSTDERRLETEPRFRIWRHRQCAEKLPANSHSSGTYSHCASRRPLLQPDRAPCRLLMPRSWAAANNTPAQIVRDQSIGDEPAFLQEFAHRFQRGMLVSLGLDQHIEDLALGVDGPPEKTMRPKS